MRPNRYMNGGLDQTSQNANYVDDDAPRLILSISTHSLYNEELFVLVSAVTKSSDNSVWHSDVIDPQMRSKTTDTSYVTMDDLIFSF
jgi:hypothetical protein